MVSHGCREYRESCLHIYAHAHEHVLYITCQLLRSARLSHNSRYSRYVLVIAHLILGRILGEFSVKRLEFSEAWRTHTRRTYNQPPGQITLDTRCASWQSPLVTDLSPSHPAVTTLAALADCDPRTALSWLRGEPVRARSARRLQEALPRAQDALPEQGLVYAARVSK